MRKRRVPGGALGLVAAVLVAGCGGDEPLSKQQYVSKLSAMCEDFSAKEREIGEPTTIAGPVEEGPRILDAFETAILEKVRTLKAPVEIAVQADRLVKLAGQQRDVIAELIDAAEDSDSAKVQELVSRNEALNKEANSIARKLGAEGCAED